MLTMDGFRRDMEQDGDDSFRPWYLRKVVPNRTAPAEDDP